MKRSAVVWVLLAMGASTSAAAIDWVNFAGIARTMGVSANRLCVGDHRVRDPMPFAHETRPLLERRP